MKVQIIIIYILDFLLTCDSSPKSSRYLSYQHLSLTYVNHVNNSNNDQDLERERDHWREKLLVNGIRLFFFAHHNLFVKLSVF